MANTGEPCRAARKSCDAAGCYFRVCIMCLASYIMGQGAQVIVRQVDGKGWE